MKLPQKDLVIKDESNHLILIQSEKSGLKGTLQSNLIIIFQVKCQRIIL
jgi:hypothetical protein